MSEFGSLGALALHIAALQAAELKALEHGLERCAKRIEETAKAEIGQYQSAAGPFPKWDELADSTEAEKARLGYPLEAPLLRTGAMQASIGRKVAGLEAVIGSTDKKLYFHEFGTPKMPPRPVMGPALYRNKEFIRKAIGHAAVSGLIGGNPIHPSLGYDGDV